MPPLASPGRGPPAGVSSSRSTSTPAARRAGVSRRSRRDAGVRPARRAPARGGGAPPRQAGGGPGPPPPPPPPRAPHPPPPAAPPPGPAPRGPPRPAGVVLAPPVA